MTVQTLDELKAENAAAEAEAQQPAIAEEETEDTAADDFELEDEPETDEGDAEADTEDDESGSTDEGVPAWQLTDQGETDDDPKFTDNDVALAKRKYGAKLERKHEAEVAKLKAQIAQLEAGGTQQAPATEPLPTLEDHDYDPQKHAQAVAEWHQRQATQTAQAQAQQTQQQQQQQQIAERREREVNDHYLRAEKLTKDSGITPEAYQATDRTVRELFDSVSPGNGDDVMEDVISTLGEGSEKLMYYIGRNPAIQQALKEKLAADPRGFAAVAYLGELKQSVNKPQKRKTQAPRPAAQTNGKPGGAGGGSAKRQYDKAHKDGNFQKALDIKFAAKEKGINTSAW